MTRYVNTASALTFASHLLQRVPGNAAWGGRRCPVAFRCHPAGGADASHRRGHSLQLRHRADAPGPHLSGGGAAGGAPALKIMKSIDVHSFSFKHWDGLMHMQNFALSLTVVPNYSIAKISLHKERLQSALKLNLPVYFQDPSPLTPFWTLPTPTYKHMCMHIFTSKITPLGIIAEISRFNWYVQHRMLFPGFLYCPTKVDFFACRRQGVMWSERLVWNCGCYLKTRLDWETKRHAHLTARCTGCEEECISRVETGMHVVLEVHL